MNVEMSYIIQNTTICLDIGGNSYTVTPAHHFYNEVLQELNAENYEAVANLVDVERQIASYFEGQPGQVDIKNGGVYYEGHRVHSSLTHRIIQMYKQKLPIVPMVRFFHNLMENPSNRSVMQLYDFLQACNHPITADGHFLAWKRVHVKEDGNFVDCHTKTINNNIGQVVWMRRNDVNDNPQQTCSAGLHFCSKHYFDCGMFTEGRVVVVKINPRDVVSIPVDYNNAKGRCCRYTVLRVEEGDKECFTSPVYSESGLPITG